MPQIELQKSPHAFRAIMVNGVRWGAVQQRHAGMYGVEYHFEDAAGDIIPAKKTKIATVSSRGYMSGHVSVWSDKKYLRDLGVSGRPEYAIKRAKEQGIYVALDDRLIAAIELAIKEKRLIGPDEIRAQARKESEESHRRQIAAQAKDEAAFRAKAAEVLAPFSNYMDADMKIATMTKLIDAMRWAQTQ